MELEFEFDKVTIRDDKGNEVIVQMESDGSIATVTKNGTVMGGISPDYLP